MTIMALVKRDIWQSVEDMLATYIKMVTVPNPEGNKLYSNDC
jgi:hypothetical protein